MAEEVSRLPHDPVAERAVLAAVLVDQRQFDAVRALIRASDFLDVRHQRIFQAFCDLEDERQSIDLVTVHAQLERSGHLAAAGGSAYLGELSAGVARSTNAADYARLVHGHSLGRQLHRFGTRIASEAVRSPPEATIAAAEQDLFRIAEGTFASGPVAIAGELAEIVRDSKETRAEYAGIRTGFEKLDKLMGGLRKSDLILCGARPGQGKTSLGLNIALAAGMAARSVLIFSLEMPRRQIAVRLLFTQAQVNASLLNQPGRFANPDIRRLENTLPQVQRMRILVDDSNVTPVELRSKARRLRREDGLDLIVVDYLQLMRGAEPGTRRFENRNLEIAEISRSLKALAMELDVPVLALSQLSRAPEKRGNAEPQLSDLRESGALEQDADIVLLMYERSQRTTPDPEGGDQTEPPIKMIEVAKNRHGSTGRVKLAWLEKFTRFQNLAESDGAAPPDPWAPAEDDRYPDVGI